MSGLFWSSAMSPIDADPYRSKTGTNVVPALVDLNTPPMAYPIQMMRGSFSYTAMSSIRPPMLAGPIDRNRKLANNGLVDRLTIAVSRRTMPLWAGNSAARNRIQTRIHLQAFTGVLLRVSQRQCAFAPAQ